MPAHNTGLPRNDSLINQIFASSVGGIITAFIMTPLDVVKIRMQSHRLLRDSKCFIYCNGLMEHLCTCSIESSTSVPWYRRPSSFVGTGVGFRTHSTLRSSCVWHAGNQSIGIISQHLSLTDAILKIVKNEGLLSLWSGLSPTLIMALPQTVIYYTVNDWLKTRVGYSSTNIKDSTDRLLSKSDWVPALVGGASRVFAATAISPLELMRTKMQSVQISPKQLYRVLSETVKQEGIRSLWTGMGPTLLRDVPYSMMFWMVFDYYKSRHLTRHYEETELSILGLQHVPHLPFYSAFIFGATAGLVAGALTHPFDVIKTHRQVELGDSLANGRPYSKSTWKSLQRLYRSRGFSALYVGFTPRLVKTTNASAIMIATYEAFKRYFAHV